MDPIKLVGICAALVVLPIVFVISANPDLISEIDREGGELLHFACVR